MKASPSPPNDFGGSSSVSNSTSSDAFIYAALTIGKPSRSRDS